MIRRASGSKPRVAFVALVQGSNATMSMAKNANSAAVLFAFTHGQAAQRLLRIETWSFLAYGTKTLVRTGPVALFATAEEAMAAATAAALPGQTASVGTANKLTRSQGVLVHAQSWVPFAEPQEVIS